MDTNALVEHFLSTHPEEFAGTEYDGDGSGLLLLCRGEGCVLIRSEYDGDEQFADEYTIDPGWEGDWGGVSLDPGRREVKGLRLEEAVAVALLRLRTFEGPSAPAFYETSEGEVYVAKSRLEAARAIARTTKASLCLAAYRIERRYGPAELPRYPLRGGSVGEPDAYHQAFGAHRIGAYRFVLG